MPLVPAASAAYYIIKRFIKIFLLYINTNENAKFLT